ncbi:MAG: 50S ribosomal protein L10 [Actinomycetia bacterium]|nr:50S ribosomal protein L10 [Actinomycetes bacterium]
MANAEKTKAVAELTDQFKSASGAVLTEYRGLSVSQLQELRRSLGEAADFQVVKNTLTKIAAENAGIDGFSELLVGPTAIAFIRGDVVEAAKSLKTFSKDNAALVVKGGVLDGAILSPSELARMADLESREVLLAKLAGAMKGSMSQAAALFAAPLSEAARAVDALRVKREEAGETLPAAPEAQDSAESDAPAADAESTE